MKQCPQCGREYDNSMMFCLDDGAELLYGPASGEALKGTASEPVTAILNDVGIDCEPPSQIQDAFESAPTRPDEGFWLAVLPFKYRGSNADLETLAEGLADEIVTGLARFPYLRVISRSRALDHEGAAGDMRTIGKEIGARYIMAGSLRQAGADFRLAVQLVDTGSGEHLWAETYDRKFEPERFFEIQDELVPRIVSSVADWYGVLPIRMSEIVRLKPTDTLSPYEALLRYFGYNLRLTAEDHLETRDSLERAVDKAPQNADCWAMLSYIYLDERKFGYNPKTDPLKRSLAAAQRAVEIAPSNPSAHSALAQARFFLKEFIGFRTAAERALELNPMDGSIAGYMGMLIAYAGDWDRGCELAERAMQMNPHHPGWYWVPLFGRAYSIEKNYHRALKFALKFNMPGFYYYHLDIAAAYGQLGEHEPGARSIRDLLELKPDIASTVRDDLGMWVSPEFVDHQIEGLRKAGLDVPDQLVS